MIYPFSMLFSYIRVFFNLRQHIRNNEAGYKRKLPPSFQCPFFTLFDVERPLLWYFQSAQPEEPAVSLSLPSRISFPFSPTPLPQRIPETSSFPFLSPRSQVETMVTIPRSRQALNRFPESNPLTTVFNVSFSFWRFLLGPVIVVHRNYLLTIFTGHAILNSVRDNYISGPFNFLGFQFN